MSNQLFKITGTSPAAASTAALADVKIGLENYECFDIEAALVGATGGTLDVYLQNEVADGIWQDWVHFPQLSAGASAIIYKVSPALNNTIVVVGRGTTPVLAANTCAGGHPGNKVRALCVAGASTSAGADVAININAIAYR